MITLKNEKFLIIVDQIQDAGAISQNSINAVFKVKSVCFFSVLYGIDVTQLSKEIKSLINGLKKLIQKGMYFSYHYDLTNTAQRISIKKEGTLFDTADCNYIWNRNINEDFLNSGIHSKWLVPLIQGFVKVIEGEINGKLFKLAIISRRRNKMAGSWDNTFGIDDDGNVANTVETEQLLFYSNNVYSFVQIGRAHV